MADEELLFGATIEFDAKGVSGVLSDADQIQRAIDDLKSGATVDIGVNIDDAEISSTLLMLDDLSEDQSVMVNVDDSEVSSTLLQLDDLGEDQTVTVNVDDSEVDPAIADVEQLGEDQNVKVNVDDSEVDETQRLLEQIRDLAIINLVVNIPQQALDFFERIPGLQALLAAAEGSNILEASNVDVAGADQVISDLYVNFGLAREEGARLVATLSNIGVADEDIGAVATELVEAQIAIEGITGEAPALGDLVSRAEDLVALGLADSFGEAMDILVAGFQSSIAVGGDFLGDLGEFAPTFAAMGFTAEQMLSTLDTGLAGGVDNISRMAEGLISFNELASGADENFIATLAAIDEAVGTTLSESFEAYQNGEITGADFMAEVLDGARTYAEQEGTVAAQGILGNLFGGTASNIGANALLAIDPNADEFTPLENRASEAATAMRDSLQTALGEFFRYAEEEAAKFLSSDQINLDQKIEDLKTGLTNAIAVLEEGGSLAEAIEIGLNMPGFADSVTRFESGVGNFLISVLELVAGVQDLTGNTEGAARTREEISRLGAQQLTFDLQVANEDEIAGVIETAIARGVDPATVAQLAGTAIAEMLNTGDIAGAQALLDSINQFVTGAPTIAPGLGMVDQQNAQFALDSGNQGLIDQAIADGLLVLPVQIDTAGMEAQVDAAAAEVQAQLDAAMAEGDLDAALMYAEQLGDTAAIAQLNAIAADYKAQFETALAENDIDTAALYASWLPEDDPAVAQFATDKAEELRTAFDEAISSGDFETALAIADVLNDEEMAAKAANIQQYVDDLSQGVGRSASEVGLSAQQMADDVARADEDIEKSTTGNTITASFDAVAQSAQENMGVVAGEFRELPPIVDLADIAIVQFGVDADLAMNRARSGATQTYEQLARFRALVPIFDEVTASIKAMVALAPSLNATLASAQAGGTVINNSGGNSTVNLNQTVNTQSQAEASSAAQQTANNIRGF